MSTTMKKTLLISLAIFLTIIMAVGVIYFVRKPSTPTMPPATPKPTAISSALPEETAVPAPVFVIEPIAACTQTFTVACASVTHKACNPTTFACVTVDGAGADTCTTDESCVNPTHKVCNTTTFACETVSGAGTNSCTTDANCATPTHKTCNTTTYACETVNGAGENTCTTDANCAKAPSASLSCASKKMYEDDSRNRAGFYYLEKEIRDTNTLSNGQIIVYNVVTKNAGGNSAPDTTITDELSSNLTYVDGDSGCTYESSTRTVTCTVGTLSANSEAQRSFRAKVTVAGTQSVANTAEVTSTNGQRDSCSVTIDATGIVITSTSTPTPTSLPVAGIFEVTALPLGIGMLLLILGGLGLLLI